MACLRIQVNDENTWGTSHHVGFDFSALFLRNNVYQDARNRMSSHLISVMNRLAHDGHAVRSTTPF